MKKNQGVSLIEILVACVIVALLVGGLASIFVAGSRWIMNIHSHAAAEEVGKLFLDPMQMHVRGSDWNAAIPGPNALTVGTTWCDGVGGNNQNSLCQAGGPIEPLLINRRHVGRIDDYDAEYVITNFNNVRKVKVTITWQEPDTL